MTRSIYVCSYENCTAMFRHSERYDTHMRKHTGEKPFICTFEGCDKTYFRSFHLKRHAKSHEMLFKCTLPGCTQVLKTRETLVKHQDEFHLKKKYRCSECSEEFSKHSMLTRHAYLHSGVKAYKCSEPDCAKSFSMPSLLKRHMKRHKGYSCEESGCGKSFPRWTALLKHRKECHPKINKCHICEKVFNYASNLKAHCLTHMQEKDIFRCSVPKCNRTYTLQRNLTAHVKTFHSTFVLPCPEGNCHRFCKNEKELEIHIQYRHRRRLRKRRPERPGFAEILSGLAKGTKKELNPHLSNTVSPERIDDEMECLLAESAKQDLSQHLSNTSKETSDELKEENSTFECLNKIVMCVANDECSKQDSNPHNSSKTFDKDVEPKCIGVEIAEQHLGSSFASLRDKDSNVPGSKPIVIAPLSDRAYGKKVGKSEELVEIEVMCHSLKDSDEQHSSFNCKGPDHLQISLDISIGKVM